LNVEHRVFRFNDAYVIWLILDRGGDLFEVHVGPKSYYTTEFPDAKKPSGVECLPEAEYRKALQKISELKDIGRLQQPHASAIPSDFGSLNTDRFERAFVDRVVVRDHAEGVRRFIVYFLQDIAGSPEQVLAMQGQPMVCLVGVWYYLSPEEGSKVHPGEWQTLRIAGPNLHGTTGCFRTTVLHDADGFTIEEPQNETIIVSDPYRVRALAGRVLFGDAPVEGVNVEVRPIGSRRVLRAKTNDSGTFRITRVPDGKYKFKVTKDGFKALSGTVLLDKNAPTKALSFELQVGT
jgi:hypothetical protein